MVEFRIVSQAKQSKQQPRKERISRRDKAVTFALTIIGIGLSFAHIIWAAIAWFIALVFLVDWIGNFECFVGKAGWVRRFVQSGMLLLVTLSLWQPISTVWREQQAAALTGVLKAPTSGQQFDDSDVTLQIGPEADSTRFKWTGPKDRMLWTAVGDKISVRRNNGKLLLTTRVRDLNGAIIVDVVDNKWTVSSAENVSWDKNYSANALEVKDRRGRVVFQVVLMPDAVRIQGEWWTEFGNGARIMRPFPFDRVKTGPIFVMMTALYHPDTPAIEPIFKYPSKEHFGEFVDWFNQGGTVNEGHN